jgi:hypothetical protein
MVLLTTCVYLWINCVYLSNNFKWSDMFSEIRRRMSHIGGPCVGPRWYPGLRIREYPMIKDLSWLKISDVFAPNIRQIYCNKVTIYQNPDIRIWGVDIVPVPGTCTCTKISKYPNIRSANLLICSKIAKYPNRFFLLSEWCCKSAKYPKISSGISAEALAPRCSPIP